MNNYKVESIVAAFVVYLRFYAQECSIFGIQIESACSNYIRKTI